MSGNRRSGGLWMLVAGSCFPWRSGSVCGAEGPRPAYVHLCLMIGDLTPKKEVGCPRHIGQEESGFRGDTPAKSFEVSPFEPVLDEEQARPVVEPDLGTKIRYRLGLSVPEEHRAWVERDVASRSFPLRVFVTHVVMAAAVAAGFNVFIDGYNPWPYLLGFTIAGVTWLVFFRNFQRRRTLEWHEKRWNRQTERDEGPDLRRFP